MIIKVKNFFVEVIAELKKVSWTTRSEVIDSTWLVIITAVMLGIFISSTDFVLAKFLSLIIKS